MDSGRALIIGGRRGFWTKGVEGGLGGNALVASEGLYLPSSPSSSFAPPYAEAAGNPVYPPFGKSGEEAGYENCEQKRETENRLSLIHLQQQLTPAHGEYIMIADVINVIYHDR